MFAPSFRDNPLVLFLVRVTREYTSVLASSFDLSVFRSETIRSLVSRVSCTINAVKLPKSVGFWWAYHLPTYIPQAVWVGHTWNRVVLVQLSERSVFPDSIRRYGEKSSGM